MAHISIPRRIERGCDMLGYQYTPPGYIIDPPCRHEPNPYKCNYYDMTVLCEKCGKRVALESIIQQDFEYKCPECHARFMAGNFSHVCCPVCHICFTTLKLQGIMYVELDRG